MLTAEIEPLVSTGGLAAASAGLVGALRSQGVEVDVVLPDYSGWELDDESVVALDVPAWVGGASVRVGRHRRAGEVHLLACPGLARPHPYVDPVTGEGWGDNEHRFFAFSRAAAAYAALRRPDIVHANDWHTATVLAHLPADLPTVLAIHNLAFQGWGDIGWLGNLGANCEQFRLGHAVNALAGGVALADRVVTVSPQYSTEIRGDENGMGLAHHLRARGDELVGILNGIDVDEWDPSTDRAIVAPFGSLTLDVKRFNHDRLCDEFGLDRCPGPLIVCVSRFSHQKGIDLLAEVGPVLSRVPARLAVLGSGDRSTEDSTASLAARFPGVVAFRQGYDADLAHRMFAGGDLTVIPSRFEPCGLTQMQAMRYGTIPIVADVGGLHDTVTDADAHPRSGNGIVMAAVSGAGLADGIHRAARLWSRAARRVRVQQRGMTHDWSWAEPARRYIELYESILDGSAS